MHLCSSSPGGRPHRAGKLTDSAREVERAVAGDAGTQAGHLLLLPGLVLNAPRHICPRAVLLRAKKEKVFILAKFGNSWQH